MFFSGAAIYFITNLTYQNEQLRKERDDEKAQRTSALLENNKLRAENAKLQQEREEAFSDRANLAQENSQLQRQKSALELENQQLKETLFQQRITSAPNSDPAISDSLLIPEQRITDEQINVAGFFGSLILLVIEISIGTTWVFKARLHKIKTRGKSQWAGGRYD